MYKDLNPTLQAHPDTHDIVVKTGIAAINGSINNLVLTNTYERPYNKQLAGKIYPLLFEQLSPEVASVIESTLVQLINNFEPRAHNVAVSATVVGKGYQVVIGYTTPLSDNVNRVIIDLKR